MTKEDIRDVPLELIDDPLVCRTSLSIETATEYGDEMISGTIFPPAIVYVNGERFIMCDGRHRYTACDMAGIRTLKCIVRPAAPAEIILAEAFKANFGGGIRVGRKDAIHTMKRMIEEGAKKAFIIENMPYTKAVNTRLYNQAREAMMKSKCVNALSDMTKEDLTMAEAAENNDISVKDIEKYLNRDDSKTTPPSAVLDYGLKYHKKIVGINKGLGKLYPIIMDWYMKGEVPRHDIKSFFSTLSKDMDSMSRNHTTWTNRFLNVDPKNHKEGKFNGKKKAN